MLVSAVDRKKFKMLAIQGSFIKFLLLAGLLCSVHGLAPKCCPKDAQWEISSRNCTDGSSIRLHCAMGFYLFHPREELETFRIVEKNNVSWLVFENDLGLQSFNTSSDSYCVGNLTIEDTTDEILLVCFPEEMEEEWRYVFFGIFSMVSSIFLAFTLFVYLILPELRDIQDKAIMSMTLSFMVAFFLMGNQNLRTSPFQGEIGCLLIAFTMYYAYLCAFFWLNIISLNIWRSVWFPKFKLRNDVLYILYCMIGWGLPLCFLVVSIITHHVGDPYLKPGFGDGRCWFKGETANWAYFYGPILVLLTMNLIYLGLTSWKLWREYKDLDCCRMRVLRFKCLMFVKLSVLMGFTWIFEVISFAFKRPDASSYWMLTDVLNALQGFFIFILLVVSRRKVRKLLAQRKPLNIPFPKSWAAYADQENCAPARPDELELSDSS